MSSFWDRFWEWADDGPDWRFFIVVLHLMIAIVVSFFALVFIIEFLGWYTLALTPLSYAFWIAVILRQTKEFEEANTKGEST